MLDKVFLAAEPVVEKVGFLRRIKPRQEVTNNPGTIERSTAREEYRDNYDFIINETKI